MSKPNRLKKWTIWRSWGKKNNAFFPSNTGGTQLQLNCGQSKAKNPFTETGSGRSISLASAALPMVSFHLSTPGFGKKRGGRAFIRSRGVTHSVPLRVSKKYSFE